MPVQNKQQNDDWNKAAMQAVQASKGSALGSYVLPAAGAYGLYDMWKNRGGTTGGAIEGALSGAAIGGSFGGPPGAAIGGLLGGVASLFGGKSRTKIEEDRRDELAKAGINVPQGRAWENNAAFADSRKESDLRGSDIADSATLYGLFGSKWGSIDPAKKAAIADQALKQGLVREHHGTIDINATPDLMSYAQSVLETKNNSSGAARKPKAKRPTSSNDFKPNPNLSLSDLMPVYKAPAPQAEPDNDYVTRFADYLKNRGL